MAMKINLLRIEPPDPRRFHRAIWNDINFQGRKVWILGFAVLIASIGLNLNSNSILIGAMLISPIMGPLNGIGYGIAIADVALLREAFRNLAIAIGITLGISLIYFLITPDKEVTSEILSRTSPSFFHVIIAIAGGVVGILAKSRKEDNNVVPGVAIATALLPPLCSTGFGVATGRYSIAGNSLLMFGLYVICMIAASGVTSRVLRPEKKQSKQTNK